MKLFARAILFTSIIFLIYVTILFSISSFPMSEFDGSLKLLSHYYISKGFIPYVDFGVVYPPGNFIFIGSLIKYNSIFQRNLIMGLFYSVIIYFFIKLFINKIKFKSNEGLLKISILIISLTLVINQFFYYDLFSFIILPIYLSFIYSPNEKKKFIYYFLFFISPFFRWDIALIVLITSSLISFLQIFNRGKTDLNVPISVLSGFIFLVIYLFLKSNITSAFDFIVNIPAFVIKPFRNLPIPVFKIRPLQNLMFYTVTLLFIPLLIILTRIILKFGFKSLITQNKYIPLIASTSLIILSIPYSLGRISFGTLVPIWFLMITFYLLYFKNISRYLFILIFLSLLPFVSYYKNNIKYFIPKVNNAEHIYMNNSITCSNFKNTGALSLFIGRISYDNFDYSNAYLYYLYKDIKPATAYISDEPGLQDGCKYGSIVANDLLNSNKPMLAFLATNPQIGFTNKKLKSCGIIENYLEYNNFEIIGNCSSYGFNYEVRLYK